MVNSPFMGVDLSREVANRSMCLLKIPPCVSTAVLACIDVLSVELTADADRE